jgi:capsule biosynthesis phosphatase
MATFVIDIDGTICTHTFGDYANAKPFFDRIEKMNNLFDKGNIVIYHTARGMGHSNNNVHAAYAKWYTYTENQLKTWGVKFHSLHLGKPAGDFYIDDRGIKDSDFFENQSDK